MCKIHRIMYSIEIKVTHVQTLRIADKLYILYIDI